MFRQNKPTNKKDTFCALWKHGLLSHNLLCKEFNFSKGQPLGFKVINEMIVLSYT